MNSQQVKEWKHDPSKGDIFEQIRLAPDYVKEFAAMYLMGEGAKPRHIRKKLDMSDRQLQKAERKFRFNQKYDPVHIPNQILPPTYD